MDRRFVARAALANLRAGEVQQGGSTITQQLIKNRDLPPKRSFGRKVSEALRALALEVEFDKGQILEAYLDQVYLGHADGLAIHGFGTAPIYFSKGVEQLELSEAATLAAMIQGPNRLSPSRHPERVRERRDWVLSRLEELEWIEPAEIRAAKSAPLKLKPSAPERERPTHFLRWAAEFVSEQTWARIERGRGVVVETTIDPWLQELAERSVRTRLRSIRREQSRAARRAIIGRARGTRRRQRSGAGLRRRRSRRASRPVRPRAGGAASARPDPRDRFWRNDVPLPVVK